MLCDLEVTNGSSFLRQVFLIHGNQLGETEIFFHETAGFISNYFIV